MANCRHRSRHQREYEQKIGTEMVKYRDIICNGCGALVDRVIVSRRPA